MLLVNAYKVENKKLFSSQKKCTLRKKKKNLISYLYFIINIFT